MTGDFRPSVHCDAKLASRMTGDFVIKNFENHGARMIKSQDKWFKRYDYHTMCNTSNAA